MAGNRRRYVAVAVACIGVPAVVLACSCRATLAASTGAALPSYFVVPIPDPHFEGGQNFTISRSGRKIAFLRNSRENSLAYVWAYERNSSQLREIAAGSTPSIDPSGRYVAFGADAPFALSLADSEDDAIQQFPLLAYDFDYVAVAGNTISFISTGKYPKHLGNPDQSWEVFTLNRASPALTH